MIDSIHGILKKIFSITDMLAGACFFSIMVLVLANIILRRVFSQPITGTLDYVCLLSVTGIGLALAKCALYDGNISMSIVTDRLSRGKQQIINIVVYLISLGFWATVVWRMIVFGNSAYSTGRISATASLPVYIFIYILAFNVFCLSVVLAFNLAHSIAGVVTEIRRTSGEPASSGKKVKR